MCQLSSAIVKTCLSKGTYKIHTDLLGRIQNKSKDVFGENADILYCSFLYKYSFVKVSKLFNLISIQT